MFSDDIISRVRDSVDIVDLVSGYVSLKKTGRNHTGLCPFHSEKTPSFSVNPDKQIFHCFGCGAGGDAFKFLELQEGLNFPEALKKLAERAGISLPVDDWSQPRDKKATHERAELLKLLAEAAACFRKELEGPAGTAARQYLKQRGVADQVIAEFGIGFARPEWDGLLRHLKQKGYTPGQMERAGLAVKRSEGEGHYDRFRGRIIFPIRDISGNVIAFGGRVMGNEMPKYLNSSETPLYSKSNTLYLLDAAKEYGRKLGYFIIVEGYLDAIACHQYGVRNSVATLGTALTEGHLRLLRRFAGKLILIFDPDPAGIKATMRGFDALVKSGMKVNVVSLPEGDDPDTFFQKYGKNKFDAAIKSSVRLMDFVISHVVTVGGSATIEERMDTAKEMVGFIQKTPDRNIQNFYIKKLINDLDIDEPIFRQEMFKQSGKQPAGAKPDTAKPKAIKRPPEEEMLLNLILNNAELAKSLKAEISAEFFSDGLHRTAVRKIFENIDRAGCFEIGNLVQGEDNEFVNVITSYATLDTPYEDPEKSFYDCMKKLKLRNLQDQEKAINREISEAESRADNETVTRLMTRKRELIARRKEIFAQ